MADESNDATYLQMALDEARKSLDDGNFPVGAVLVIDGKLVGTARNLIKTNSDWVSHAENLLIIKYSSLIKQTRKGNGDVVLYTSFEPCLMCFGAVVGHRLSRVVYSCPDPYTGATQIDSKIMPVGYARLWSKVEQGPLKEESKTILLEFLNKSTDPKWILARDLLKSV